MTHNRIYLCLAHMSGQEQMYIQEAFDTNWVVPLGPNVNAFEENLKEFVCPDGSEQRVVAVWIKLDSEGPVFYRQVRVGRNLLYVLRIIFKTFYVIFRGY